MVESKGGGIAENSPRPSEAELAVRTYVREALFTGLKLKNIKFCARSLLYVLMKM